MNAFDTQQTVGEIVSHSPELARVFERLGIDYCCRKDRTVEEVCSQKGLDPQLLFLRLQKYEPAASLPALPVDSAAMSLTELVNHIEQTHHVYLRDELPRLSEMINEMAAVHAEQEPRLPLIQKTLRAMAGELWAHMMKEEMCLFPMIRQLEACERPPKFHIGSIADPVRRMELEHDMAERALEQLREYTNGFVPPAWACGMYRAMLEALRLLEKDMRVHIHKEDDVLFPRALELEAMKRRRSPVS
jgi:regulator of cell morphogenesis and NO signaling